MSLSSPFIRRPVATTLFMVAFVLFGWLAYQRLPVSDLPTVDYPVITVSANLAGASPETMAAAVATPLEQQFSTISGIDQMTSSSTLGSTSIVIQFALNRDIDAAAQDVQAAISKTLRTLPQGIIPPSYQKSNPAAAPILYLALTSDQLTLSTLDDYGETFIGQRLSMVDGVAQVSVFGSQKYAVRIQLDPRALANRTIGIDEVAAAVQSHNVSQPTGILWGSSKAVTVEASGELTNAAEFRQVVVRWVNGAPVHLGELGRVVDDVQNNKAAAWIGGTRGIVLAVQRQPGTNTVQVVKDVRGALAELMPQVPASVKLQVVYDRSQQIQASVHDVELTLALTVVLVVLVIFAFLRSPSATIIPSLALPLSIVGTFTLMWAMAFSLDNLSLMALTLATGFVVDDAVVMLENIVRHVEMGKERLQAAMDGAAEVGFTILSMTLSLVAVFIPLLFMPGVIGRLFHEFAVTISAAILVSGIVSLTLTPMLASRLLRARNSAEQGHALHEAKGGGFDRVRHAYERMLHRVMAHRPLTVVASLITLVLTALLFRVVQKGFIPKEDTGQIQGSTLAAQGASYDAMVRYHQRLMAIVARDTNVATFISSVGSGGRNGTTNQGTLLITLKPSGHRLPADQVIEELRPKLASIPGVTTFLQLPAAIQIGGQSTQNPYQLQLQSPDVAALYKAAQQLEGQMHALPALASVVSDLQVANPQVIVQIDRGRAAALGVTPSQVESALYDAYGSAQVSTIYTPTNQYWVVLELLPQFQSDADALGMLYVRSSGGALVPLSSLATLVSGVGPLSVNHASQRPAVTISFDTRAGVSLGEATAAIEGLARRVLPAGVTTAFAGNAQAFQSAQSGLIALLAVAILVIYLVLYLVLGILYESFVHPLTILTGLPFAAFGALLTLWLFHAELDVYAYVGLLLLVGIVKKNAIMMIDFALERERSEHVPPATASVEAALVRFRPIMMTTFAALMAALPIALGFGAGADTRRPLGLVVVGGLAFSQLVTLLVTPVFYTYFDELPNHVKRWWERRSPGHLAVGTAGSVEPL
jgi:hydrophobic/amphiphilic exporter-1 (mainly G- bacteria), HAE1 family